MPTLPDRRKEKLKALAWLVHSRGDMAGAGMRERRRCVRCGRVGFNAFHPVSAADRRTWACTHVETCGERARLRRRSKARRAGGRPATSSIAPTDLTDRPACVVGSNPASVAQLQKLLTAVAGVDVECLPLTIRSLDIVSRRDFGLVVFDAQTTDSIALLNELTRRLAGLRRRGTAIIVSHDPAASGPSLEQLITKAGASGLARPVSAIAILEATGVADGALESMAV